MPTGTKVRKLLISLALIFLAIAIFIGIAFGVPIRRELSALEIIINNPEHVEEKTIVIEGWYRIGFLGRQHLFRGRISILEYQQTRGQMALLEMSRTSFNDTYFSGLLFYPTENSDVAQSFAAIYTRPLFLGSLLINIRNEYGFLDNVNSPVVVASAASREDALEMFRAIFEYEP